MATRKFFHNLSQGPPNPGFMQKKVQKGDFLKKDSRELKFFSCFRFLWISRRPETLNWERVVFLLSKIIYRKCVLNMPSKKDQQKIWSFYPSEPFKNGHFNVRHPVLEADFQANCSWYPAESTTKLCQRKIVKKTVLIMKARL